MSLLTGEGEPAVTEDPTAVEPQEPQAAEPQEPTGKPAWMAQLPDEFKEDADLARFAKLGDIAKAYKELMSAKTKAAEGAVKNADEYELPEVEYPEGMESDPDTAAFFKGLAFELGLNKKQTAEAWRKFNEWTVGRLNGAAEAEKQQQAEADATLKRVWGNLYSKNLETTRRFLKKMVNQALLTRVDDSGLGDDAEFLQLFFKIAQGYGEDTIVTGETPKKEEDIVDVFFPQEKSHIQKGRKTF